MRNRGLWIGLIAAVISIVLSFSAFAGEWMRDGDRWWFRNSDGSYPAGGICTIGDQRYVFDQNGYLMENQWVQFVDGSWAYCTGSGAVAKNQWVGDYYVGEDGYMKTDTWIGDYYVGSDGRWDTSQNPAPFRDAPLGSGYHDSNYGYSGRSELETADIHRYNDW